MRIAATSWYNWGDETFLSQYKTFLASGIDALILVANEREGALLVKEIAELPSADRRPIFAHWGVTGGRFYESTKSALGKLDFSVVQTYSLISDKSARSLRVGNEAIRLSGVSSIRALPSPVGIAHAYDLTHILAKAIDLAGSTDREAIRAALERVKNHDGLIRRYPQPFTASRHDALDPGQAFLARYAIDGAIEPISFTQ